MAAAGKWIVVWKRLAPVPARFVLIMDLIKEPRSRLYNKYR